MPEPDWEELSESARAALYRASNLLIDGFTGRLELECNQGGVKQFIETRRSQPKDFNSESYDPT